MTNHYAKIRAALDVYGHLDDSYAGWTNVFDAARSEGGGGGE